MRAQHRDDSLELLASRLDCSLSTVRRHLRRARQTKSGGAATVVGPNVPSMDEVFDASERVVEAAQRS
jgi:hypothetical protein